jgi:tetratricopeptide (TPR) repeat protein
MSSKMLRLLTLLFSAFVFAGGGFTALAQPQSVAAPGELIESAQKFFDQRRFLEAEREARKALEALPAEDSRRAGALRLLGTAIRTQGRFADAVVAFEERLKLEPESEATIDDVAICRMGSGEAAKAIPLYEQLLTLKTKQLEERSGSLKRGGVDETPLIPALQKLARAQEFSMQAKKALELANRVMTIRSKAVGSDHPDLAPEWMNLGRLYLVLKNDDMAAASFQFALEILEKAHGLEDSRLLPAMDRLAAAWKNNKRVADAELLYRRALAIREATFGGLHPDIAQTLDLLAKMLFDQARFDEAEPIYRRSLAIWMLGLGPKHVLLAMSLDNLAVTLAAQKKYDEADEIYKMALAIRDADDVSSLRNLAFVAQARTKPKETEAYLRRALATIDTSPEKSEYLISVLKDLSENLRAQNKGVEAAKLETRRKDLEAVAAKVKAVVPEKQ